MCWEGRCQKAWELGTPLKPPVGSCAPLHVLFICILYNKPLMVCVALPDSVSCYLDSSAEGFAIGWTEVLTWGNWRPHCIGSGVALRD